MDLKSYKPKLFLSYLSTKCLSYHSFENSNRYINQHSANYTKIINHTSNSIFLLIQNINWQKYISNPYTYQYNNSKSCSSILIIIMSKEPFYNQWSFSYNLPIRSIIVKSVIPFKFGFKFIITIFEIPKKDRDFVSAYRTTTASI